MKVSVYLGVGGGEMTVLLQASPGKGKPPMILSGITLDNLLERIRPAIEEMRLPKGPQQLQL